MKYSSLHNQVVRVWYLFPILAFLIPFAVRTIPEILMGPYVIGFDTMAFYIPNTLSWLHNGIDVGQYLVTAPLFYAIYMSLVAMGGPPVIVLKIISPILLGALGLSMYGFAKKGLGWSNYKSLFVAILGTVYFVALRASWDQLREEIGLVFLFLVLTLLITRKDSWKRYSVLFLAVFAVVLAHQLVAVLMFGIIFFIALNDLLHKQILGAAKLVFVSLPPVLYFLIVYLGGVLESGFLNYATNVGSPLANWSGFTSYLSMLGSVGGFLLYCFLLILPLALIGIWRLQNIALRVWLGLSLLLMLLPIVSVSPYRWVLMLIYPLAFFATDCLSRLGSVSWKRFNLSLKKIAVWYLVLSTALLSFGYILTTPERPFVYFNPGYLNYHPYQIPTAMLQNTVSVTDCQDTVNALQWFKSNTNGSAVLLTHTVFYSWAMLNLDSNRIRDYGFGEPDSAGASAVHDGNSQVYLIWWVNGQGWYNQSNVSPAFKEVYESGQIAIYNFTSINSASTP